MVPKWEHKEIVKFSIKHLRENAICTFVANESGPIQKNETHMQSVNSISFEHLYHTSCNIIIMRSSAVLSLLFISLSFMEPCVGFTFGLPVSKTVGQKKIPPRSSRRLLRVVSFRIMTATTMAMPCNPFQTKSWQLPFASLQ